MRYNYKGGPMPMEWGIRREEWHDEVGIAHALERGWEPFSTSVVPSTGVIHIYFKKEVWNEEREPRSSTHSLTQSP
jgi:hypothetical protein